MKINFKQIEYNDNQREIVDKINLNFDQVLYSGIGYVGDPGQFGAIGITGPIGARGNLGITGENASTWYRQNESPTGSEVKQYDYWINTSPGLTGSGYIYYYDGSTWVYTGETLTKSLIFTQYQQILGPGSITSKNAILSSNSTDPWFETFVFGDYQFTADNINPNYSKVRISLDGESELPIFTLSKLNYPDPQAPSIYWHSTNAAWHGIDFNLSGSIRFESGGDLGIYAGSNNPAATIADEVDGRISINTDSLMSINTTGSVYFNAAGKQGNDLSTSITFSSGFVTNTSNMSMDSSLSTFDKGLEVNSFAAGGASFDPRISVISKIPSTSVIETNSYSFDALGSTEHVELEDFRTDTQNDGEGAFRTEMTLIDPTGASLDTGIKRGYVKYGFPGVTGSYPLVGTTEVSTSYTLSTIGGTTYSVINLSGGSTYYANKTLSIVTQPHGGGPTGPSPDSVWIKINTSSSSNLAGIFSSDDVTTYRFNYRGSGNNLDNLERDYKFGGITWKRPQKSTDSVIEFKTPVYTFEITYVGAEGIAFYKTVDDSGIIDMSSYAAEEEQEAFGEEF